MAIPGLSLAVTGLEALGVGFLQSQQSPVQRRIGSLIAQVTIEEDHEDEVVVTDHPVEQGSTISDHAYKMPALLRIQAGWSNSPSPTNAGLLFIPGNIVNSIKATAAAFSGTSNYSADIYDQWLALQVISMVNPITVVTGKRSYDNMVITRVRETTNADTENCVIIFAELKRVNIVSTQTLIIPVAGSLANPSANTPVQDTGGKSLLPGNGFKVGGVNPQDLVF